MQTRLQDPPKTEAVFSNAATCRTTRLNWLSRPPVLLRLGLVLMAVLYVRTIRFDFVYDDLGLILTPHLTLWGFWRSLPSLFSHDLFGGSGGQGSVYYRPLSSAWILAIHALSGGLPGWFHLSALLLHLLVIVLAYEFGRLCFSDERLALVAALLFGLHPTKAEAVAWIGSSACDGLGGVFFFATLICYLKWRENNSRLWLVGSVALFAAALLTKETLIVLPVLIAAHFWLNAARPQRLRELLWLEVPYAALVAAYLYVRKLVLVAPPANSLYIRPTITWANLWSAPLACWFYLKHLLLPAGLAVRYQSLIVYAPTLRNFGLPAAALILVIALGVWAWWRYRCANCTFLVVWFLLTLSPVIVLSPMVRQHDRYLYLPSYAFCVLVSALLLGLKRPPLHREWWRATALALLLVAWSASAWHESGFWDNELTLWQRALSISPQAVDPRVRVAMLLNVQGNTPAGLRTIEEGILIHPRSPGLWQAKGDILSGAWDVKTAPDGRSDPKRVLDAKQAYRNAIEFSEHAPASAAEDFRDTWPSRVNSAYQLGKLELADGEFAAAEQSLRKAAPLYANDPAYRASLARALEAEGKTEEAKEERNTQSDPVRARK